MKYLVALVTVLGITSLLAYQTWFVDEKDDILNLPLHTSDNESDNEDEQGIEFEYEKDED